MIGFNCYSIKFNWYLINFVWSLMDAWSTLNVVWSTLTANQFAWIVVRSSSEYQLKSIELIESIEQYGNRISNPIRTESRIKKCKFDCGLIDWANRMKIILEPLERFLSFRVIHLLNFIQFFRFYLRSDASVKTTWEMWKGTKWASFPILVARV